ncbi:WecB/TagA/CpsF family glycosyltransferase [Patescibacteria group bacterium]|nr:WecB/TagA/CpsF family glycosyltransferase [Patescibacteria group bacterium]MBU0963496.1 WecB/TagA/CpsF family glycosyltransferase [Patescibacteria group bacterium]
MSLEILGVKIHNYTIDEVLEKIHEFFNSQNQHYIVTTNPEFIMAARHDDEFRHILNKADLSVADGVGIKYAARRLGQKLKQRITGVDLLWEICRIAEEENKSIFLLGSKRGIPEKAAENILSKYPKLKIVGAECGYRRWHRHIKEKKLVEMINRHQPDILFVAFGQVKQEKWIYHNLPKLPLVKLAMGVGGSFDYISGKVKRAPSWMRNLGLEWLYRLMRQPWRLPRIITAVVKFSCAVRKDKNEV